MLGKYGITAYDIKQLNENNEITRISRGKYILTNIDKLYNYGKQLLGNRDVSKAQLCFASCFKLDSKLIGACFQLFINSVVQKNYDDAIIYIRHMHEATDETSPYRADTNYFLYLLNEITTLPKDLEEYTKKLTLNDIRVPIEDKRYKRAQQNKNRTNAFHEQFYKATSESKKIWNLANKESSQEYVIRHLLTQAYDTQNNRNEKILALISEEKYEEIISILEAKNDRTNKLNYEEKYTLKILQIIMKLKNGESIPQTCKPPKKVHIVTEAILNNEYSLALRYLNDENIKRGISNDKNMLYIALQKLCNLIEELHVSQELQSDETTTTEKGNDKEKAIFEQIILKISIRKDREELNHLKEIIQAITQNNQYLLIILLIKVSILEGDSNYTKPESAIIELIEGRFKFNQLLYVKLVIDAVTAKKYKIAEVYLEIIKLGKHFGEEDTSIVDTLENLFKVMRKGKIEQKSPKERKRFTTTLIPSQSTDGDGPKVTIQEEEQETEPQDEIYAPYETAFDVLTRIDKQLMKKRGVIVLEHLTQKKVKDILSDIEDFPSIKAISIGSEKSPELVIVSQNPNPESIDLRSELSEADNFMSKSKYSEALEIYTRIMYNLLTPKSFIFGKIGFCYHKMKQRKNAIQYLTVAYKMGKLDGNKKDYMDLIVKIQREVGDPLWEELKAAKQVKMTEKDFHNDENYGIDLGAVEVCCDEYELSVIEACEMLNFTQEQIALTLLLYAKEYFECGNKNKGELFLKTVQGNSCIKTNTVRTIMDQIIKNKKLYLNRGEHNYKIKSRMP